MTRTDALKGVYFARFAVVVACGVGSLAAAREGAVVPAAVAGGLFVALFLAGRLQAHLWSDLLLGLHKLNQGDPQASKRHSERFLARLRERPWLGRLIWLGTSSYTLNAEAMTLNNLGAAEIELGEFESARAHLDQAIALDPLGPLPHRNMGALLLRTGPSAQALPWFEKAAALGLRGDLGDRMVQASQSRNAQRSAGGDVAGARRRPEEPPVTGAFVVHVLDDDKTPFEFVLTALETTFGMTGLQALRTARRAHEAGRAACAGFDDAEAARDKAEALEAFARAHGHALSCAVEPG